MMGPTATLSWGVPLPIMISPIGEVVPKVMMMNQAQEVHFEKVGEHEDYV